MQYERRATATLARPAPGPPEGHGRRRGLRRRWFALGVLAAAGTAAGVSASLASTGGNARAPSPEEVRALKTVFLEVNNVTESLGAPTPPGSGPDWLLEGVPLVGAGTATPHLAATERRFVAVGRYLGLTPAQARATKQEQMRTLATVAAGTLQRQLDGELAQLIGGETGRERQIVSPGGAAVQQWEGLSATGDQARIEAIVSIWEQKDTVVPGAGGGVRLDTTVTVGQVDAVATLERRAGRWRVTSLSQSPYPQPT